MKTIRSRNMITGTPRAGVFLPLLLVLGLAMQIQPQNLAAEPVTDILGRASSLLGTPYRSGGMQPGGFDCSGFVSYLLRPAVPGLPRISRDMARTGDAVDYGEWKPGDLLFYATGADPSRINHVAIWYGNGAVIHSISDGPETGVVLTPAEARYWKQRYVSARRVLPEQGAAMAETPGPTDTSPADIPKPPAVEESPWNDFEGYLRGDFEAWRQADQDAFEAYKKQNG